MSSLLDDKLSRSEKRDLDKLKGRSGSPLVRLAVLLSVLGLIVFLVMGVLRSSKEGEDYLGAARENYTRLSDGWQKEFLAQQDGYREWIRAHSFGTEFIFFDQVSEYIMRSAMSSVPEARSSFGTDLSITKRGILIVHSALLRILFIVVACWRLWLVAAAIAFYLGLKSLRPYVGKDFLGMTGIGRPYYSGIRGDLRRLTPEGWPDREVTGLACPGSASDSEVTQSDLYQLLKKYDADTPTTRKLVGIILHYSDYAGHVADWGDEEIFAKRFKGVELSENALLVLGRALELHRLYGEEQVDFKLEDAQCGDIITPEQHAEALGVSMHRVLSRKMRKDLAEITTIDLATTILAYEAGKVLAFEFGAGRWYRKSNYPQLSARAVLQSIHTYNSDYAFESRMLIRRSLIYASRRTALGPVRLARDLSGRIRALRQWIELLIACPHELDAATDDVEMYGIILEANLTWSESFLKLIESGNPEVVGQSIATSTNQLFIPLTALLATLKSVVRAEDIIRLESLISKVSQRQRERVVAADAGNESVERAVPAYERIFTPLSQAEIKKLAERHKLSAQDLRDWSSLRVILNSNGWLARRVGDYTVPESSVIFAVFKVEDGFSDRNEFGLVGRTGVVTLRNYHLEEQFGRNWAKRFSNALWPIMAESRELFDTLLAGGDPDDHIDSQAKKSAVG